MSLQTKLFINGKFIDSKEGSTIKVLNPHDDSQITEVSEAKAPDIDDAVAAAKKAFPAWRDMQAAERGRLLLKLADLIERDAAHLAEIEVRDNGSYYLPEVDMEFANGKLVLAEIGLPPGAPLTEITQSGYITKGDSVGNRHPDQLTHSDLLGQSVQPVQPGDIVEASIDGIGVLKNKMVSE